MFGETDASGGVRNSVVRNEASGEGKWETGVMVKICIGNK